jgi:serine/threonine protein kinase/formylglycine-generating enzyme required for sulfatase activity
MNAPNDGKMFLQLCVTKRLLDKAQAKDIWQRSQQTGEQPQQILVTLGLMAPHTIGALAKELRQAQEPRVIAGFRLIKPLGQGGMATVYLASQISLAREVALKLISPQIAANPEAAERFLREARVAAAVNHPNVISIIDVGQADGQLFMALELVTGGDAAQLAVRFGGVLPEVRALELLIDCTKGLQALFEARLLHRDLKPANIFITKDGIAKLGDLGLARSEDGDDRMTTTGHLVGTPAFMSPEQASGEGVIDIRSDIYALGATLFALVTGRQPFIGNSPIAVAAKALTEATPDPRTLNPTLSALTATLIMRAMSKAPKDRFQTPEDMHEALRQALAKAPYTGASTMKLTGKIATKSTSTFRRADTGSITPVTLVPDRRTPHSKRFRRTQPPRAMISIAVLAVLVFILILVIMPSGRPATVVGPPLASIKASEGTSQASITTLPSAVPVAPPAAVAPVAPIFSEKPDASVATHVAVIADTAPPASSLLPDKSIIGSPPVGAEPPKKISWASSQGKDKFGYWLEIKIHGVTQRLRWLPPGECVVGSPPNEAGRDAVVEAQSQVTFSHGCWMADTECTQSFWEAVGETILESDRSPRYPINRVSLREAIAFTHKLQAYCGQEVVRIPSRAEWERACRAGAKTAYATGDAVESLADFANASPELLKRSRKKFGTVIGLKPVATFFPNQWGFYDMHGNVSEYCLGQWESLPAQCSDPAIRDDINLQKGFLRGGAYHHDVSANLRCAAMPYLGIDSRPPDVGFRFLIEMSQHQPDK